MTDGNNEIVLASREGKAIRFKEKEVRDMGRSARGVKGIKLSKKDQIIGMEVADKDASLLTVTSEGFGKRTKMSEYRLQSRGGKGIINMKLGKKNGEVVGFLGISDKDEFMLITEKGMIVRCPARDIRVTGRSTQGVRLIKLGKGDTVSSVESVVAEKDE
jgi:DNA gyrase subunit A